MDTQLRTVVDEPLTKAVELRKLKIDENSGVDDPANGVPGWLLMKAATFHPDEPGGDTNPYPNRETIPGDSEEFAEAARRLVAAFEDAEGREPTDEDENFIAALAELYERYFPVATEGRGSWTVKKRAGALVKSAIRGLGTHTADRLVMRDGSRTASGDAYSRAYATLEDAFYDAEGRLPEPSDENFTKATGELFEAFFGGASRQGLDGQEGDIHAEPEAGGWVAKAMRGIRATGN